MSNKVKILIPCDEANHVCDKTQYSEASLLEKIKLSIHLIYCNACRNYTKNNGKLTKAINGSINLGKSGNTDCLKQDDKELMKRSFEEALKKQKD